MNQEPRSIACPYCGKRVEWSSQNAFRPFCSDRCKLIDLGAWASERYRVPVIEDKDELESNDTDAAPPPATK
jgi:uncharacterized protein